MNDALLARALLILGALAAVLIGGAIYLTAIDKPAEVVWTLAGTAVGSIGGLLVPRSKT